MSKSFKDVRVWADSEILRKVKEKFPETRGMTYSGCVDWALRYLLALNLTYEYFAPTRDVEIQVSKKAEK